MKNDYPLKNGMETSRMKNENIIIQNITKLLFEH